MVTGDTTARPIAVTTEQHEGEEALEVEEEMVNVVHQYYKQSDKNMEIFQKMDEVLYHVYGKDDELTFDIYNLELSNDPDTPKTIREALSGRDSELWTKSGIAEVNNFLKRGSWKFVKKEDIKKEGRKIIGTKWVFKIKNEPNGDLRYKSRIVTKGYMQIPGVDYTERFSPVAQATSLRTGLAITLYKTEEGWICELVDVEAAFLEGKLTNTTYIDLPPGIDKELGFMTEKQYKELCIELLGGMYGNVDAALLYFRTFTEYVTKDKRMNMKQSKTDPCVSLGKEKMEKQNLL